MLVDIGTSAQKEVLSMISWKLPSLRQLRTFEAVSRLESVSAAAREINLSQPGITQAIHA
jgi:hypothetical protein